jgi:hypothetical protein
VWAIFAALWFANAAVLALYGTNVQAALARERLLGDADPLVAAAGRLWRPYPAWMATPAGRRRRSDAEAKVRVDPARGARYDRLRRELSAWNALESSSALAATASIIALGVLLFDW